MRIDFIEITNYRQYQNVKFDFKKKKEHDLHIIKGKNGMGKTNVLNAITWCLYNEEPHLGKENSGEPRLNISALKEARNAGIEKCEIVVRVCMAENDDLIIFERKQNFGTKELFEYRPSFIVTHIKNGEDAKIITDDDITRNYVNRYVPGDIREYFFFNGEHLEQYFVNEQGEKIKEAIHVISQVQLLTSMRDRLKRVIDDLEDEAGRKNKNIDVLVKQKNDLIEKITSLENVIKELSKQITLSSSIIAECENFMRGKEGVPEKEKEFEELNEEIKRKLQEKKDAEVEIHKFIRRYKTLFSIYPSIKYTYDLICKKEKDGAFPPVIEKDFVERMIIEHKCLVCKTELIEHSSCENEVKKLLERLSFSSEPIQVLTKIKSELENLIDETKEYKAIRDMLLERKKTIELTIEHLVEKINKIDVYLKGFTDKEKIKDMHQKRLDNTELNKENNRKVIKLEVDIEKMNKDLDEIKLAIERGMAAIKEFKEINKKITFAKSAYSIISDIELEMMNEVREKMRCETMHLFKDLAWKKDSYSHIDLNEKYNLELYDNDGFPTVGTSSAGERSILALSFTLALQKVSGYDSMLLIDTPVGRIDTENRVNFAEVLKNVSLSKQIILTFTTSEYSQEIRNVFEPIVSSFTELVKDENKVTTLNVEV